jgi:hypothetical protein
MKDWDQDRHWTEYIITLKWGSVSIRTYSERSQRSTQEPKRDPSGPEGTARTPQATDSQAYAAKRYTVIEYCTTHYATWHKCCATWHSCATWHMNCNICTVQYDIRHAYGGHKTLCGLSVRGQPYVARPLLWGENTARDNALTSQLPERMTTEGTMPLEP